MNVIIKNISACKSNKKFAGTKKGGQVKIQDFSQDYCHYYYQEQKINLRFMNQNYF
jgi:hypothetical protein